MASLAPTADGGLKAVLIAFDFSEASRKALHHALAAGRHYKAKFYLAHVVSALGYSIAGKQALDLAVEAAQRDAEKLERELLKDGSLAGLEHEFIVREGNIWEQLEEIIKQKQVDMVVVGTHGRGGLVKLVLGSVAEQIFRHADCPVDTVGAGSYEQSLAERTPVARSFLFPTDFSAASLHALPHAISFANHFGAKLVVLHVLPAIPIPEGFHWSKTGDLPEMREKARMASQHQFEELHFERARMAVKPEFEVKFGTPGAQILLASNALKADLIILGLKRRTHVETASHMPWDTAYEIVRDAHCPVLTIRD